MRLRLLLTLFSAILVVYSPLILATDEFALNTPAKKVVKKSGLKIVSKTSTTQRSPAATKKTAPPPKTKKNLKKGKNVDTSAKKKALTKIKPRPNLPTQTRAEMLAKSAADAKMQEEAKAKLLSAQTGAPAANPSIQTATSGEADVNQPLGDETASADPSLDQPIDEEIPTGGDDVALDLGASEPDKWNPYTFGRSSLWILLPFLTLAFLGLHLLPVPKRRSMKRLSAVPDFLKLKDQPASTAAPNTPKARGHADG